MDALAGERMITYDARGLAEPDDTVPHVSELDGGRAVFDAKSLTTRQINLELRWLLYEEGVKDVTVLQIKRDGIVAVPFYLGDFETLVYYGIWAIFFIIFV